MITTDIITAKIVFVKAMMSTEQEIDYSVNHDYDTADLITPYALKQLHFIDSATINFIVQSRKTISDIINNQDKKLLLVVGPCSIHDPLAAMEYAKKLKKLSNMVSDKIFIVMRLYFSKPRTSVGWQGFINDPFLDGSNKINTGLAQARELLIKINQLGIPIGTEFLDNIIPQYILDLISWAAIGARSVESQTLRNFVSGLTIPVGFKNATSGTVNSALDALITAAQCNLNMTIDDQAKVVISNTSGNVNTHIILRGGHITGPNYEEQNIVRTLAQMQACQKYNINKSIMIDCSHGNSQGNFENQTIVFNNVVGQLKQDHGKYIKGIMLESFLQPGRQDLDFKNLKYGLSITDACLGWDQTTKLITNLYKSLANLT